MKVLDYESSGDTYQSKGLFSESSQNKTCLSKNGLVELRIKG